LRPFGGEQHNTHKEKHMPHSVYPLLVLLAAALPAVAVQAQTLTGTLKAIQERNAIWIGFQSDAYPMSFVNADGQPDGYSVDLCRRIAADAGKAVGRENLDVRYVPVTLEGRFEAVRSGKVDIECGTTTATLSRMKEVDFTHLTFVDGGSLLVKKGSAIRNVASLVDETVAVIPGTTTYDALRNALARSYVNAKVVEVADHAAGIAAVEAGKVSAYASDRIILIGLLAKSNAASGLELAPAQFSYEPYGLMLRRGDADFRLLANRTLARTYRSEDILKIFNKWFGALGKPGDVLVLMYALNAIPE
jgi:ABC-type amino acid transport substrate-binding protein